MDYTDKEILKLLKEAIDKIESRNDADYMINSPQFKKLSRAYRFFVKYAKENGGRVDTLQLVPRREMCGITAYYVLFAPFGDDLQEFKEIVQNVSALSFDTTLDDEVCISLNIPDVFVHR